MKKENHIIILPIAYGDRTDLERIGGEIYKSHEDVRKAICLEVAGKCIPEQILIMDIHDFCDYCNDEQFDASDSWIGNIDIAADSKIAVIS
jgi:hypothetical protein